MAVHVASDPARADEIERLWQDWAKGVPLTIIESPYRSLARPLLHYLAELKRVEHAEVVTVVLPGVHPGCLVAAHPPRPVRPVPEAGVAVPARLRGGERAVPHQRRRGARKPVEPISRGCMA